MRRLRAVAKGHDDLRRALVVRLVRRPDQILHQPNLALGVLLPEPLPQQPRARRVRLVHVLVRLVRLADWIRDVLAGDDARPRPGVVEGDGEAQLLEQRVARLREGRLVLAVLSFQRVVALLRLLELVARHVARRSPIDVVDRLAGLGVPVLVVAGGAAHGFFLRQPLCGVGLCVCRGEGVECLAGRASSARAALCDAQERGLARRAWPRCARVGRWESDGAGGLPPEMRRRTTCGDEGPLRGANSPGSIPYMCGRARLVGASKPTCFYFGSTPWVSKDPSALLKKLWR